MCKQCELRGKTWNGDEPQCGFVDGVFTSDNWMCATLLGLRHIAEDNDCVHRVEDDNIGVIPVSCYINDVSYVGFIVLVWYKSRGKTSNAYYMRDGYEPTELTLELAEEILNTTDWRK